MKKIQSYRTLAPTPQGYIKADTAYYYVRDHQGSVRQVVSGADGRVVQENQYYPYGALHGESSAQALANGAAASPYKYGDKEHLTHAAANLYDFTARLYDPALALFHSPDPLQEKYYPLSPWLYCAADPVNHIDPTGCAYIVIKDEEQHTYTVTAVYITDKDSEKSTQQAVDTWNALSITIKDKKDKDVEYTVNFNLTVEVVDPSTITDHKPNEASKFSSVVIEKNRETHRRMYNSFEVLSDEDFGNEYSRLEGDNNSYNVNGTTVGSRSIKVRDSKSINTDDATVYAGAHEVGHTLGLLHTGTGLMSEGESNRTSTAVSNAEIESIITKAGTYYSK